MVRNTTEFISKAIEIHNGKYSYDNSIYTKAKDKLIITCKVHGDFEQTPDSHIRGGGCPKCRRSKPKLTTAIFIEKAIAVHGDIYDYSDVDYVTTRDKVNIMCKVHGVFQQVPNAHLSGYGCQKCGGGIPDTADSWITKAKKVHGDKYNYDSVNYVTGAMKVKIGCPVHGDFWQKPTYHLTSKGCIECANISRVKNSLSDAKEFISKAHKVHGTTYDYSMVNYINSRTPVRIQCRIHGQFLQKPNNHLSGRGCSACAQYGYSTSKPGMLYYLRVVKDGMTAYKIGITNLNVVERYAGRDLESITIIKEWIYQNGQDAKNKETFILSKFKEHRWKGPKMLKSGNTELFSIDILGLDSCTKGDNE